MKKIPYLLVLLFMSFLFVACDNDKSRITRIHLGHTSGTGTIDDPFIFDAIVDDLISAPITINPIDVVKDFKFTLVKKINNEFVELSSDDIRGISFNEDNSNDLFSVKALVVGTFYVEIKQEPIKIYVQINIKEKEDPYFKENFKVLAIGNSFSNNAMTYLYEIADNYGVQNIILGTLYIGGADLLQHANYAKSNKDAYEYIKNDNGIKTSLREKSLSYGLKDEDWDIIVIQQASGPAGRPALYEPHLTNLLTHINEHKTNEEVQIFWYLTWAHQANSIDADFPIYECDQKLMYDSIINAYIEKVKPHKEITGLIPTGTAIQNVRTSIIGDILTSDGYHLSRTHGCFIAGLSWFKAITKFDISKITYHPYTLSSVEFEILVEAINNSITKPLEVTESSYPKEPTQLWHLPIRYVLGYWTPSSAPIDIIKVNHNNFVSSKHLYSKREIPSETKIEITDGYKYNITFYKEIDGILGGGKELINLTESLIVDYKFWEDFEYIGITVFSITNDNLSNNVNDAGSKLIVKVPYKVISHEDVEPFFITGYWPDNGIEIKTGTDNFTKGFLASNILSIDQVPVNTKITIASGYKIRLIFLTYSPKNGYKVAKRTDNYTDEVLVTEELYENYDYIAINISAVQSTDISSLANTAHELLTFTFNEDILDEGN